MSKRKEKESPEGLGPWMSPGELVVARFGASRLARYLGVHPSTVLRFSKPVEEGGRGGLVPSEYQVSVLEAGKQLRVRITPLELIYGGYKNGPTGRRKPAEAHMRERGH